MTESGPAASGGGYLNRTPERLVVNGLRLWAAGYETGELDTWQEAWNLYAIVLGPQRARPAVTQLSLWVKAICIGARSGWPASGPGAPLSAATNVWPSE